ncbi:glycosyltransferase family 1 protein [Moesziomyces antarcticus]|uniref:Sterol 3-beta-glucosyltransferase n=2 Tax=Pseudozyma antarctica TaxID=84753 RepID=A0A081CFG7_PSEA2|nr:glycosyltransferase family 1 protein [Moesziomyces antarcticus]GAK65413.1 glycosyltransferase family 1 protein [Moesziomyces antarcticus]SPO46420.1 probable UDP-glucose:sterol glucosyltransferase [Moesziomyces antarcticus]
MSFETTQGPVSTPGDETRSASMATSQGAADEVHTSMPDNANDAPPQSVDLSDSYGTPPFPKSPRLDPSSPRNFSTISSLAGSRELGRPVLEPTTRIFAVGPTASTPPAKVSLPSTRPAEKSRPPSPGISEGHPADVAFHAEPQGLMQMLSLVGSTLLEAERVGFTEDDTDELEAQPSARTAGPSDPPEIPHDVTGSASRRSTRHFAPGLARSVFDLASAGTAKGRLRALAREDASDDGSTPQGSRSPLDGSVHTIGASRKKRISLTQSEIFASPSDPTADSSGRRASSLRSQLQPSPFASGSTSTLNCELDSDPPDSLDQRSTRQTAAGTLPIQKGSIPMQHQLSSSPINSIAQLPTEGDVDPLLIRPYSQTLVADAPASGSALDHDRLEQQLRDTFQLDASETLVMAQPCWLFRSLLLQGHLYLTNGHLCFYAYLPSRDEKVVKTGVLGKRTRRTHRFSKHWASLQGSKLSWFDSDRDPYFPQGHIDLRKVSAIEPSQNHKDRFKLNTPARKFTFLAEDEASRNAWVSALQKETFRAQNQGESVRISIPLETIMNHETTLSVDGTEMVCISVVDEAGDFSVDEYYFLHLSKPGAFIAALNGLIDSGLGSVSSLQSGEAALNLSKLSIRDSTGAAYATAMSRRSLEEVPTLPKVPVKAQAPDSTVAADQAETSATPNAPTMAAVAIPQSGRRKSQDGSADGVFSTTPRAAALNRLSMESTHTYPPSPSLSDPPTSFDQVQREAERSWSIPGWLKSAPAKVLGRTHSSHPHASNAQDSERTSGSKRRRRVLETWSGDNTESISREGSSTDTEDDMLSHSIYSTQSGFSMLDADDEGQEDLGRVAAEFRDTFGVVQDEGLVGHTHAYLYRVLPVAGRFFVSERHLAFRSSGIAAKTVGRTLMLVPLQDVISAAKQLAFRPGHHGMVINISGHEELFIEISSANRRDELLSLIEYQLELISAGHRSKESRDTVNRERSHALVLRDLSEKITDDPSTTSVASSADSSMLSQQSSDLDASGDLSHLGGRASLLTFAPTAPLTFTMLTIGSRGDVQPYIALAKGLQADGHNVRIATHAEFGDWIMGHGIGFSEIGGDPAELMRICVENGTFTVSFLREGVTRFRDWLDDLLASAWRACQGSDVIIECPSAIAGIHVAEALQVPYFRAFTMPWTRTRAYPHAFAVPNNKAGGNYNYMSYVIFDQMFWRASSFQINRWRKALLGLKPTNFDRLEQHKVPFIYNFSPSLVPRPLDWYEWIHVTGFWFLDNPDNSSSKKWEPPEELVTFIRRSRERKRKLVYIGWGSIVVPDAEAMTRCVLQAVRKSGVCAILSKGWSDRLSGDATKRSAALDPALAEDVFQVSSVPHDWLFPQIDAACHHGGAGTLGASLRAGLPTVVKPYFGDQFFWGQQIESLGVGSCVRQLTADSLAAALITATTNAKQIERARKLGEQIRAEDGIGNAVKAIYRDLDYARSRVKRHTRIESDAPAAPQAENTEPTELRAGQLGARPELARTASQGFDDGHSSDGWSDIGGAPLSPSPRNADGDALLDLGRAGPACVEAPLS